MPKAVSSLVRKGFNVQLIPTIIDHDIPMERIQKQPTGEQVIDRKINDLKLKVAAAVYRRKSHQSSTFYK